MNVYYEADMSFPSQDKNELLLRIRRNNEERSSLIKQALEINNIDPVSIEKFITKAIPQSQLFMAEIIQYLHKHCLDLPDLVSKTVLDVGPQTFAGTALLSGIHSRKSTNRLRLTVSALDVHSKLSLMKEIIAPEVEFIVSDIYDLNDRNFDFVIASHVIEHVPEPERFMRAMQQITRDFVIVAAPWMEEFPLAGSHVNVVDEKLVAEVGGEDLQIFTNYCWGKHRHVCLFKLPGLAG